MNTPNGGDASSTPPPERLPDNPSLEHLQKQAKALAKQPPGRKLAAAQHQVARLYGFKNWAELAREVKRLSSAGPDPSSLPPKAVDEKVVAAVIQNDLPALRRFLDSHPEKIALTGGIWNKPLLHCAAWEGHIDIVRELLARGADVNARCESDHACAIHFAAERNPEIVRLLADAGADIEAGDNDHRLNVLGWATCFGECNEDVARFLLSRGAKMTVWSAIALNDADAVRRLVAENPSLLKARMSRNEYHRTPLHHAVHRNRPEMVELLLELGADPKARDSLGLSSAGAGNATTDKEIIEALEAGENGPTLQDALATGRYDDAEKLLAADPDCIRPGGAQTSLFVYAVCRKDWHGAEWLLARGADIDAVAEVYECPATALHFAIESAPVERVRWLLDRGADTHIPDRKYQSDALGWADFFHKPELVDLIQEHRRIRESK